MEWLGGHGSNPGEKGSLNQYGSNENGEGGWILDIFEDQQDFLMNRV